MRSRDNNSSRRVNLAKDQHATATKMEPDAANASKSNYNRYTEKQLTSAKCTLQRAIAWRRSNPTAWDCIVEHALDLAENSQPIAAQALVESVRKKSFVDSYGNDTKTNNDFASVFTRWLCKEHPEVRPYIKLRKCPVGWVMEHAE